MLIRQFRASTEELVLDKELYKMIVEDMQRHGGIHKPGSYWQMQKLFKTSPEKQESPDFDSMMAPWVGPSAMEPISEEVFAAYRDFLAKHDYLGLLSSYFPNLEFSASSPFRVADLSTIMEINFIARYAKIEEHDRLLVLEVGGGYGRLAEAFLNVFDQVKYVLIDAVPASIYYAYAYLSTNCPDRRVGFYYKNDEFDLSVLDCYIIPAWHFQALNEQGEYKYDVCINIASMQEMERDQVDYYLRLFDRVTKHNGVIYLCNSRDFAHKREYTYPSNWRLVFKENTPHSRSPYYPVEILYRLKQDYSKENAFLEALYLKKVCSTYREEISKLREKVTYYRTVKDRLHERLRRERLTYQDRILRLREDLANAREIHRQTE